MGWGLAGSNTFYTANKYNYFNSLAFDVYYLHNLMEYILLTIFKQCLILARG
jgi:hypothetical protein